jgi:hypothetical protein
VVAVTWREVPDVNPATNRPSGSGAALVQEYELAVAQLE